jgi:hypothetical protein
LQALNEICLRYLTMDTLQALGCSMSLTTNEERK